MLELMARIDSGDGKVMKTHEKRENYSPRTADWISEGFAKVTGRYFFYSVENRKFIFSYNLNDKDNQLSTWIKFVVKKSSGIKSGRYVGHSIIRISRKVYNAKLVLSKSYIQMFWCWLVQKLSSNLNEIFVWY